MSGLGAATILAAYRAACEAELAALKPGNVHAHAAGHGMTVADFVTSAAVSALHVAAPSMAVGARILAAVEATSAACGQNTNLGIVLLAAPLAAAAERSRDLRQSLGGVLAGLTRADAEFTYRAIRLAAPGGLGRSDRHDVASEPTVTLLEAMRAAAGRDRIALQYATCFADVLGLGVGRLLTCRAAGWSEPWATCAAYMAFLGRFADSHVARKHGDATAAAVRERAARLAECLLTADDPASLQPDLLAFDQELKQAGINPGTSADLTVASYFAAALLAAGGEAQSSSKNTIT